ncbi:ATPase/histidine kinase/DNA gyrase B/HSP90 domain protein [Marvinbryantia formatexigens DSM 14469]|uniref:histidine kinase n=1 Tax=Marvinbryantia formatexigens DSM 14469 TaxID=478749 RepID=C6LCG5_9FIRM|nr:HAMP domain-containing sensor histidine kinase [Marvinbryantia formatexigens]EET61629.1 ATPase/histidine kinase/DNA gyrase B/HSP90 domain protein [Marvinbryantia formatexigens DSM 14469]UWO24546.1 HAMP domain-containing histidine kinase [Marvinbryantia formatexigens DSM 14469]SDF12661.1 Histidine kinase-, DNA gyrase B-, and HSP90-like ATPase [Marvinbryantia formatexigens]
MRSGKRWQAFVAAGFIILYLTIMLACTFLVKGKYLNEFEHSFQTQLSSLTEVIETLGNAEEDSGEDMEEAVKGKEASYQYLVSTVLLHSKYQQYAAVFYDKEGKIAVRSQYASAVQNYQDYRLGAQNVFSLSSFFSEEEIDRLARYALERQEELRAHKPEKYRFLGKIAEEDGSLLGLFVQRVFWQTDISIEDGEQDPFTGSKSEISYSDDKNDAVSYVQTGSEVVWEWESRDAEEMTVGTRQISLVFPGLTYGYRDWKRWKNSDYLQHTVPEDLENYYGSFSEKVRMSSEAFQPRFKEDYTVSIGNRTCDLTLLSECRPWAAAMDYMKYVYLAGFLLMTACMTAVMFVVHKNEERRSRLEENQRDFINAMAHEMKTPLGIIRGFAENLQENTVAEKKDYYLQQIIGQTEVMDSMVADIIGAARLESQHLVLQKEMISVNNLLRKQLGKFGPLIEEKGVSLQFSMQEVFELEGDNKYLEKAFANLIDNAVSYCDRGGIIKIVTDAQGCRIENTCASVQEEDVQRAFDIFYRGKRTASAEKHLGIGLYLARKILNLHAVRITAEKTPDGFRVTCKKTGGKRRL